MADVGGGRVFIEAVGSAEGFREDLRAKVDAAATGVKAVIGIEVDSTGLRERLAAEARLAAAGEEIKLRVSASVEGLRAEVDAAKIEASIGEQLELGLGLKEGAAAELRAEVDAAKEIAQAGNDVNVGDGGGEAALVGGAGAASASELAESGAAAEASGSTSALGGVSLIAAAALFALAGGLTAAAGAAGALIGAIAPLGGLLAALPAVAGVGAGVLGTLFAGLHGVVGAVTSLGKAQAAGGGSASSYGDAQHAAAERVQQAQQTLSNALRSQREEQITGIEQIHSAQEQLANTDYQVAQQRIQDARAVTAAEYSLQQAEISETDAQRQLNEARQEAARNLETMANAAVDAHLSSQQAELSLEEARKTLAATDADPNATALQRKEAALAVAQAEQQLKEAREADTNATKDNNEAQKKGIDGADQVISATEELKNAKHSELLATQALTDAQNKQTHDGLIGIQQLVDANTHLKDAYRQVNDQERSAAQAVAAAQQGLADAIRAQKEAAAGVGGAAGAANTALSKLTPVARAFAEQIRGIIDGPLRTLQDRAQQALIPGLSNALTTIAGPNGLWPQFTHIVTASGTAIGRVGEKVANVLASPKSRAGLDQLATASHRIITLAGTGLAHLVGIARSLGTAALPLVTKLTRGFAEATGHLNRLLGSNRGQKDLEQFFEQVYKTTHAWGQILKNVGSGLLGILKAAAPAGNSLNSIMQKASKHFADFVNSAGGQNKIRKFFESAVPVAHSLGTLIDSLVKSLLSVNNNGQFASMFDTLAKAAPAITRILSSFAGSSLSTLGLLVSGLTDLIQVAGPLGPVIGKLAGPLFVLSKAMSVATKVKEFVVALKIWELNAKLAAAAQWLLDAAMDANPVVLVVAAIAALVVGFIELYKHSSRFRAVIDAIGHVLKAVFLGILHAVGTAIGFVRDHLHAFSLLLIPLLGPLGLVIAAFENWGTIVDVVTAIFDAVVGFLQGIPAAIFGAFGSLARDVGHFFRDVWNRGYDATKTVLGTALTFVKGLPQRIFHALASFGRDLYHFYKTAFLFIFNAVKDVDLTVLRFVGGLPGRIFHTLAGWGGDLYRFAVKVWDNVKAGFKAAANGLWTFISSVPGKIAGFLVHLPQQLYDMGVHIMEELIAGIGSKIVDLGNKLKSVGGKIVDTLNPFGDTKEGPMSSSGVGGPDKMGVRLMDELGRGILSGRGRVGKAVAVIAGEIATGLGETHPQAGSIGHDIAVLARTATLAAPGSAGQGSSFVMNGNIYNPAPEPAGVSLATRIRRVQVLHEPPRRMSPTRQMS